MAHFGILKNWKFLFLIGLPIILLPLLLVKEGYGAECRCGFVIIMMGVYWMLEVVPFPVTAFLPIVLFPLLGVQDTASVSRNYMKEQNMMLVGSLIVALGVEYSGLHRRVARSIIATMGTSPSKLLLGTMLTTSFLSMWIPNSAAAAILVPIVLAILDELSNPDFEEHGCKETETVDIAVVEKGSESNVESRDRKEFNRLRTGLLIGVITSANIGGLFWPYTAHSSVPLYFLSDSLHLNQSHEAQPTNHTGDSGPGNNDMYLTLIKWMIFNLPPLIVNILIGWLYLVCIFLGADNKPSSVVSISITKNRDRIVVENKKGLETISFHEILICLLITFLSLLCVFRDPKGMRGWGDVLGTNVHVGDSSAAMFIVFLLFLIPKDFSFLITGRGKVEALLDWKFVQNNLPWGVVLLMGGGFAIADACRVSGLSVWLAEQLIHLKDLPHPLTLLILMILSSALAEFLTNTASANLLIPIVISISSRLGVDGLYLTFPVTLASSTAFLFPVATPSNAIVHSYGKVKTFDMIKTGIVLNISSIIILFVFNITYGYIIFGYHAYQN